MKNCKTLIEALIGILILASSATGIQVSVSSNAGGFTEVIDAGFNDRVSGSTIIASDRLSNSIQGNADFKESHSVSNTAGATAEVGVDIRDAEWYSYNYDLWPGQGHSWKAARFPQVAASEDLDVLNASYIEAYADASSSKGHNAGVSTVISDPENEASLIGYSNLAMASKNEAFASQTYDWASSPNGYIQADLSADFTQMKSRPLRFSEDKAETSIQVDRGYVEGYSDLASASTLGVTASQQIDVAIGEQIQTGSLASSRSASLFQGLKAERAKVNTRVEGSLTGYNASAESRDGSVEAEQTGQIIGSFTSTALAGSASKTRNSNYGTIYDFAMQARKDTSGSYVTGNLGYYVDNSSPTANRIQGAVDAAESGDTINVLPGTYFESVAIEKSLSILGMGAEKTVINGNLGDHVFNPVFKIGEDNNNNIDVSLLGLAITNGSGKITERGTYGGGIYNEGRLTITNCSIYGRPFQGTVMAYGGGIYNTGIAEIINSIISGNSCERGGGIYNSGTVKIKSCTISENQHGAYGGGVYNNGIATITDSNILGNSAIWGGGIYNNGTATITNSIISGNSGGGIYSRGMDTISGSTISENSAGKGGGISSYGTTTVKSSTISGNSASDGGGIANIGIVTVTDSTISGNSAGTNGGGVANEGTAVIVNSTISKNSAWRGGGVSNYEWYTPTGFKSGTVTIANSTISDNSADLGGGGVNNEGIVVITNSTIFRNSAQYGGGVNNYGTATIAKSTISRNLAYRGGGVHNFMYRAKATITDSTISENLANYGGGVAAESIVTLKNSKIWKNNVTEDGGGIYIFGEGIIEVLENSSINQNIADSNKDTYGIGGGIYRYWSGTLDFVDTDGDGLVDPNTIVFDNHLGNGYVNNIEPPLNL